MYTVSLLMGQARKDLTELALAIEQLRQLRFATPLLLFADCRKSHLVDTIFHGTHF